MTTIPANHFVDINPTVLPAGGSALDLNGLLLTNNARVPIGTVVSLASAAAVSDYFGASATEKTLADKYFAGFDNSNKKPGAILFARYPSTAVSAFIRGGDASGLSLANLQALNGTLVAVVDGTTHAATINLAAATSFSNGASIIQTGLNTPVSVTGSVAANVVVGRIDVNTATASISGTTMTVTAMLASSSIFAAGQTISGSGVASGTTIIAQLSGPAGSTGTYQVSVSQSVPSTTITASGGGMTVSAITTGALVAGQTISGAGITSGTTILAQTSGTAGSTGGYTVSISQTVAPGTTITATGGLLTVTAVATGILAVGDVIAGTGITVGNTITALKTGTGGTGTYFVSVGDTAASTTITVSGAGVVVTYDSVSGGFVITSGITGAASTIAYLTGTISASLFLTAATGATLSQGAPAAAPEAFMDALVDVSQNWASFMTVFNPDSSGNTNKLAFATWVNGTDDRYAYVCWDNDATPALSSPATSSLGYLLAQGNYAGTTLIGQDAAEASDTTLANTAAFVCGAIASIDFDETNGRTTLAYRSQSGLVATVTSETAAVNLEANGYNYYGATATANDDFVFFYPGSISGDFLWIDSYINQIWLGNELQLALLNLLTVAKSIPYNPAGFARIEAACADIINAALNFGAFRPGVTLSASQIAAVNADAGIIIAPTLSAQGYFLQIKAPSAAVRQARGSPSCKLWYVDGQSIQSIDFTTIEVQ